MPDSLAINAQAAQSRLDPETAKVRRLNKLKKACSDLEANFVNNLLQSMHSSIPQQKGLPMNSGRDTFESIADRQLADQISKGRGIGLGQTIYDRMLQKEKLEDVAAADQDSQGLRQRTRLAPNRMPKNR